MTKSASSYHALSETILCWFGPWFAYQGSFLWSIEFVFLQCSDWRRRWWVWWGPWWVWWWLSWRNISRGGLWWRICRTNSCCPTFHLLKLGDFGDEVTFFLTPVDSCASISALWENKNVQGVPPKKAQMSFSCNFYVVLTLTELNIVVVSTMPMTRLQSFYACTYRVWSEEKLWISFDLC